MSWYIVVQDSGEVYSIGTQIADPMPDGLTAYSISDEDAEVFNKGKAFWDAKLKKIKLT